MAAYKVREPHSSQGQRDGGAGDQPLGAHEGQQLAALEDQGRDAQGQQRASRRRP